MKTRFFILTASTLLLTSCYKEKNTDINILDVVTSSKEGKGAMTEKTFNNLNFTEISVATGITADVIKSDENKVIIYAPSDIINKIEVENTGDEVKIRVQKNSNISGKRVKATVYTKDLTEVSASSAARINIKDQYTRDHISIDVSSSGSIFGDFEVNDLSIDASSAGRYSGKVWAVKSTVDASSASHIELEGKINSAEFDVSSAASINAGQLTANQATLDASSGGSIKINIDKKASANASSGGNISITKQGNPSISQSQSSGGSVSIK
ncbi:MAG: DUF2807 domain-containing protein [Cloacibacterium sp.]|nr:DUF2807 domain-containing protein [Cloacibacterium sp.]